uniref:Caveolae associated protein 1 n=1 Tax=Paramormyrops kingsleyae TaxID=1676925 RepID=A0A3B3Q674_9TELE
MDLVSLGHLFIVYLLEFGKTPVQCIQPATSVKELPETERVAEVEKESDAQINGTMVLTLLDKIIGVVDQIQQTQGALEARQQSMERAVMGIQGELAKLSKSHNGTTQTVNKMLEKVRKVNVNVKTVRSNLEKQAGQIKKLERNESELLKRRNFKVFIYQVSLILKLEDQFKQIKYFRKRAEGNIDAEEDEEEPPSGLSPEDEVEIEEIIEESRAQRIKRSGLQRMDNIKKAFSKEKMEKTRQKTQENLKMTRQRTRENLEKTRHNFQKKMGKLSTRMSVRSERKEKLKFSREKMKKSFKPDHAIYARSKVTVYRVPPFTFRVKKIRGGEVEVQGSELDEEPEEEAGEEEGGAVRETEGLLKEGGEELPPLLLAEEDLEQVTVKSDSRRKTE